MTWCVGANVGGLIIGPDFSLIYTFTTGKIMAKITFAQRLCVHFLQDFLEH